MVKPAPYHRQAYSNERGRVAMKFPARVLLVIGAALSAAAATAAPQALPETLATYSGSVLYVDFWASWCVPCAQSFPWLNSMQTRYGKRLKIVAVNVDENHADAEKFLSRHPADFPIVFDPSGKLAEHYRISGMPSAVILAPDGRILHRHAGFREEDAEIYESAIAEAVGTGSGLQAHGAP
jgi:thiol-disulfide isomerase/thioredoxin